MLCAVNIWMQELSFSLYHVPIAYIRNLYSLWFCVRICGCSLCAKLHASLYFQINGCCAHIYYNILPDCFVVRSFIKSCWRETCWTPFIAHQLFVFAFLFNFYILYNFFMPISIVYLSWPFMFARLFPWNFPMFLMMNNGIILHHINFIPQRIEIPCWQLIINTSFMYDNNINPMKDEIGFSKIHVIHKAHIIWYVV